MFAHFALVDAEHERIEDGWGEVVTINLTTFVRGGWHRGQGVLDASLGVSVLEKEEETGWRGRDALVKEGATLKCIFFIRYA